MTDSQGDAATEKRPFPAIDGRNPVRVLMVLENCGFPLDNRLRRESDSLIAAGFRVCLIGPAEKGQPSRETLNGVEVFRYPEPPQLKGLLGYAVEYGYSMLAIGLLSLLALVRPGFDVIHVSNPPDTLFLVAGFYKLLGKRFIFDLHDPGPETYLARLNGNGSRSLVRALKLLERLSCRVADHVITVNESCKRLVLGRDGVTSAKVTVVRNGPDAKLSAPREPDQALRQRARYLVGYLGIMGPQDGVDYLLRAMKHLIDDEGFDDVLCVLFGRGEAVQSLRLLAADLGIEDKVVFAGFVRDFGAQLTAMDVCAVPDPSNEYNNLATMIKMMEYMAHARPIVAFDMPENRISAGDTALYAVPNDERDFARRIALLLRDQEMRDRMGAAARARLENVLAWQHQEPALLSVYEQVLARD